MTDVANVSLCKACIPAWWMCLSMICQWNARGIPSKTLPFGGGACDATFGRVAYIDARHNLQHMGALERACSPVDAFRQGCITNLHHHKEVECLC